MPVPTPTAASSSSSAAARGIGLPPQYSLFGKVVKGLDVVDAIQNVATGGGDRPKTDVVIRVGHHHRTRRLTLLL
ncbi:MAG: peptidylprolyl isomerase [Acidimicrobiales bacterium]